MEQQKNDFDNFFTGDARDLSKQATPGDSLDDLVKHTQITDGPFAGPSVTPLEKTFNDPAPDNSTVYGTAPGESAVNLGEIIPADDLVDLGDKVFSTATSYVIKALTSRNVKAKQLQATKEEKDIIAPHLKKYLDTLNIKMTPLNALLCTVAVIYGMKGIDAIAQAPPQKAPEKPTDSAPAPVVPELPKNKGGRPPKDLNSKYMRRKAREGRA